MARDVRWNGAAAQPAFGAVAPRGPRSGSPARPPFAGPPLGVVPMVWSSAWITLYALGDWSLALPVMLLTLPVTLIGGRWRRAARRRAKEWRRTQPLPVPTAAFATTPETRVERRMTTSVVRAETSAGRIDADSVALVRELEQVLMPLLSRVRERGADAAVRHDLESIACDHLPAVLDAYLALPPEVQHRPDEAGTAPADVLRRQLLLLVEGVRQLDDAVRRADLAHQQELGRFLDAKFRRSDLEL